MKKILFISYYFPPCAKSGAHRVLRLASEMEKYNWVSVVLTVKDSFLGRNSRIDQSLIDSFKGKIFRSRMFYPCKKGGNGLIARSIRRIWSEIMFPDDQITWAMTATLKAINLVKKERVDCVFITGRPFSSFLIGYILKILFDIPVCLDYRDPWTGSNYYIKRKWKHFLSKKLERMVLSRVDRIFTVTPRMTEFVRKNSLLCKHDQDKFSTLTYSFSPKDYHLEDGNLQPLADFNITFAGSSFGVADPQPLLNAMMKIKKTRSDVYGHLLFLSIGNLMDDFAEYVESNGLRDKVRNLDYVPYRKALMYMKSSQVLLLPYNMNDHMRLCLPVKIYDYLALQKPVLYYGPKGQIWDTISNTRIGYCRFPNDINGIVDDICAIYDNFCVSKKPFKPNVSALNAYRTDNVVRYFVEDIEHLTSKNNDRSE